MTKTQDQTKLVQQNVGFLYPYGLEKPSVFWPAMIIPRDQIDDSLPRTGDDEILLQFFENKCSIIDKNDDNFVLWNSEIEPFKSFYNKFYNHKTAYIRRAAIFMQSGHIDQGLKWKYWKKLDNIENKSPKKNLKRKSSMNYESRRIKHIDKSENLVVDHAAPFTVGQTLEMFKIFKKFQSTASVSSAISKPAGHINIHDQFVNLLMKDGKKAKAAALVHETFIALKTKYPNDSPIDLLTKAVSKASPLLKLVSQKRGSKSIQIPTPLTIPQQRRFGILWIINGAKKRSVKQNTNSKYVFGLKLAEEIIGVLKGAGHAIDKKKELYTHALQNKGNIIMNSGRKK